MVAIDPPVRTTSATVFAPINDEDRTAVTRLFDATVGRRRARRGQIADVVMARGLAARTGDGLVGAVTFIAHDGEAEILAIAAPDHDVFRELLTRATEVLALDHRRVFTVATNAETGLQRRLMRSGFRLCAVRPGSVLMAQRAAGRAAEPMVVDGIPITDELEFEWVRA